MNINELLTIIKASNDEAQQAIGELRRDGLLDKLANSDLSGADLQNVLLDEFDLHGVNFSAANLSGASLKNATLWGATLVETILHGATLYGSILIEVNGFECDFSSAIMSFVRLDGSNLSYSNLSSADLSKSSLRNIDLTQVTLNKANLTQAYISQSNLQGLDLTSVTLDGAQLLWCDLKNTTVSNKQLYKLSRLRGTVMPQGMRYDGRYNLAGDIEAEKTVGTDIHDPTEMAKRYGVSLADYVDGQEWASRHLPDR